MIWMLIAYLTGMFVLIMNPQRVPNKESFRTAWIWFAWIPLSHFVFALFKAGNMRSADDLALIAVWEEGVGWLCLAFSMFALGRALTTRA